MSRESETVVLQRPARHSLDELAELARGPLRRASAHRAVAFGSYARNEADGYADLDLLVVLDTDLPRLERPSLLAELHEALPVPLDLVVFTPREFAQGLERDTGIFASIADEGVTIYEGSGKRGGPLDEGGA